MPKITKKIAIKFIVLLGLVSLFADATYEGGRSITGPFLSILGASGLVVGVTAGLGEFIGYALRGIFGYLSDKTKHYWTITFIGYAINLISVPLLALAGNWQVASCLIILERFGKAVRTPARDTLISFASKHTGRGYGFGLHELLDQVGAMIGPLGISLALFYQQSYRFGFMVLAIPAFVSLMILTIARFTYRNPQEMEEQKPSIKPETLSKYFWVLAFGAGLIGFGFTDFALIAYHFQKAAIVPPIWISLFYSITMATAGITAFFLGKTFDRRGIVVLPITIFFSSFFAPFVFMGNFEWTFIGVVLWGLSLGTQDCILRAIIAKIVSPSKRGFAYGMLSLVFGVFWFAGSALKGYLYDVSILSLVVISVVFQLLSIPVFLFLKNKI